MSGESVAKCHKNLASATMTGRACHRSFEKSDRQKKERIEIGNEDGTSARVLSPITKLRACGSKSCSARCDAVPISR